MAHDQTSQSRLLVRKLARELSEEEKQEISAANGIGCNTGFGDTGVTGPYIRD